MGARHEKDEKTRHAGPEVVFAIYRPHAGKAKELEAIVARHMPTLREMELVTERPSILVRSEDGTLIEVFEWCSNDAAQKAHEVPAVAKIWEAMGKVSDFATLGSLAEAKEHFPHFTPVS
ncbi:hypothetical protein HY251_02285 [bacterium]|nr:hypothetical protein [bacterium]